MKELTFAFSCQLNDEEDYIPTGSVVKFDEKARVHEGFIAVIITDGLSYSDEPVQFIPFTDYFMKDSFVEFRN
jgi:hypothetical protein